MKISRWKVINALKSRLLISLVSYCCFLPIIGAGILAIIRMIQMAMQGRSINYILNFDHNWWIYIFLAVTWLGAIYFCLMTEKGLLFDVLFLPLEKQTEVPGGTIIYPAKTDTWNKDYASEYWIEINRRKKIKPLRLFLSKELVEIPKGIKYNFYYLKYSKLIVNVEVLEGGRKEGEQAVEIPVMDPPVIPQYSKEEFRGITKTHRMPLTGLFCFCVAGLVGLALWGICSWQYFSYWYQREIGRCITIWIFLFALEIIFVALFHKKDRGYFRDMHCKEICVTEVIPIKNIYGKKFWYLVDIKIRDRIRGIELEVTDGMHKKDRFLLYRGVSTYWDCFPMCASLPPRFRDRFTPGKHKMKAVRLYYLKHSKVVVKMDVVDIGFV